MLQDLEDAGPEVFGAVAGGEDEEILRQYGIALILKNISDEFCTPTSPFLNESLSLRCLSQTSMRSATP